MKRVSALLIVILLMMWSTPVIKVKAQAADEYLCSVWGVIGPSKDVLASDIIGAASAISYISRFTLEWIRLVDPATEFQINLAFYCTEETDSVRIYQDIINTLRAMYPERWGHLQPQ